MSVNQGLDTEFDWIDILSLGEQQGLAFARLFLQATRYAVLDEATSALDVANERLLYEKSEMLSIWERLTSQKTALVTM